MFNSLGLPELLVILGIAVLIFGARRLPELGDGIGKAIRNFKRGVNSNEDIDVQKRVESRSSAAPVDSARRNAVDAESVEPK
ncbi:MAG: twin-arginine translocase TatA/TatE family subunit [Sandaracinaceae bacterium]|nr:twin-arginine translocase TatA/TatE family subunit [Sandaracinaceae bacterium]